MIVLPVASKDHLSDILILVLSRDDFERVKQADPMQVSWTRMVTEVGVQIHQPTIVVCYEEDMFKLMKFLDKKDIIGALKHLERGHKPTVREGTPLQRAIDTLGKTGL